MGQKAKGASNVSLGGKLNKQKGEVFPDQQRYGQKERSDSNRQ